MSSPYSLVPLPPLLLCSSPLPVLPLLLSCLLDYSLKVCFNWHIYNVRKLYQTIGFFPIHSYSCITYLIISFVTFALPPSVLLSDSSSSPMEQHLLHSLFLFSPFMQRKARTAVCLSLVYFVKGDNPQACTILWSSFEYPLIN